MLSVECRWKCLFLHNPLCRPTLQWKIENSRLEIQRSVSYIYNFGRLFMSVNASLVKFNSFLVRCARIRIAHTHTRTPAPDFDMMKLYYRNSRAQESDVDGSNGKRKKERKMADPKITLSEMYVQDDEPTHVMHVHHLNAMSNTAPEFVFRIYFIYSLLSLVLWNRALFVGGEAISTALLFMSANEMWKRLKFPVS